MLAMIYHSSVLQDYLGSSARKSNARAHTALHTQASILPCTHGVYVPRVKQCGSSSALTETLQHMQTSASKKRLFHPTFQDAKVLPSNVCR